MVVYQSMAPTNIHNAFEIMTLIRHDRTKQYNETKNSAGVMPVSSSFNKTISENKNN